MPLRFWKSRFALLFPLSLILCASALAQAPAAPVLAVTQNSLHVEATWSSVPNADGYTLYYAAYPSPQTIYSAEMGAQRSVAVDLEAGQAYYVAVRSHNASGFSEYSNIVHFITEQESTVDSRRWSSCVSSEHDWGQTDGLGGDPQALRVLDKWGRNVSTTGITLQDWEGFLANPEAVLTIVPPTNVAYPVKLKARARNAPRMYISSTFVTEHPWGSYGAYSVHNETGPLFGVELKTAAPVSINGGDPQTLWIMGGVDHDMSDAALASLGLVRNELQFSANDFPKKMTVGIHPDREAGDESYTLEISLDDNTGAHYEQKLPVNICDLDQPERETEFKFHIDYSTDWGGYLEGTSDGKAVESFAERALGDIAYFFKDMTFDTMPAGACNAFVNWTQSDHDGEATNAIAYNDGFYIFINSHSGGGSLAGFVNHKRNGVDTGYRACGFWGANPRDVNQMRISSRIYAQEDDFWRNNQWIMGKNGECLGDTVGDPGQGCIECPEGQEWCPHFRVDGYWPDLHELTHGLVYGNWPRWAEFIKGDSCMDDPIMYKLTGMCTPVYQTDHPLVATPLENNKLTDWGRTLLHRFDLLAMSTVGWELRETSPFIDLAFTSTGLIDGKVGSPYADIVHITGGIPTYRFRVTSGTLPPGLNLNSFNGEITGQPTTAGSYAFTVTVNDHDVDNVLNHNGESRDFTIEVSN